LVLFFLSGLQRIKIYLLTQTCCPVRAQIASDWTAILYKLTGFLFARAVSTIIYLFINWLQVQCLEQNYKKIKIKIKVKGTLKYHILILVHCFPNLIPLHHPLNNLIILFISIN